MISLTMPFTVTLTPKCVFVQQASNLTICDVKMNATSPCNWTANDITSLFLPIDCSITEISTFSVTFNYATSKSLTESTITFLNPLTTNTTDGVGLVFADSYTNSSK